MPDGGLPDAGGTEKGIGVLEGNDFHRGLSSLGYDESLTLRSLFDEPRRMRLRFMNVYGLHGCLDGLSPPNLDGTKMTRATVFKASTYRRMPWKNGAGETVEIAVSPEGAALSDFDWRISMATVATDGPFSIFPGIDRTLSILEGNGMSLSIDGGAPVLLTQDSDPLAFPADVSVSATLADGTITDLNVMSRRASLRHKVERIDVDATSTLKVHATTWVALCHRGDVILECGGNRADLGPGDAFLLEGGQGADVVLSGRALCYLIAIEST